MGLQATPLFFSFLFQDLDSVEDGNRVNSVNHADSRLLLKPTA